MAGASPNCRGRSASRGVEFRLGRGRVGHMACERHHRVGLHKEIAMIVCADIVSGVQGDDMDWPGDFPPKH